MMEIQEAMTDVMRLVHRLNSLQYVETVLWRLEKSVMMGIFSTEMVVIALVL